MFNRRQIDPSSDVISRSYAVISFSSTGDIIDANDNFLNVMGYRAEDLKGQHHRMFVCPEDASGSAYGDFWRRLGRGEAIVDRFRRIGNGGREVWIEASYNPIFDKRGSVERVVKYATDITERQRQEADANARLAAIDRSMAVIEFDLNGTILTANANFLDALGYRLEEVKGQHHRIFVEKEHAASREYQDFWAHLARGQFEAGQYKRIRRDGQEIWIEASYNPIFDARGVPVKVVKFATDITAAKRTADEASAKISSIDRSLAVIEFDISGNVLTANENFLSALGYRLDEIQGKHHRLFVERDEANHPNYAEFWKRLGEGEFEARVYKRIRKDGTPIWIQASYNPILDSSGKPFKVVKFATDMTALMTTIDLADETSGRVQSVAAAVEELSASVVEISRNMTQSTDATQGIISLTKTSNEAADRLVASMTSMQGIVDMIDDIARQVSLLSLNATIEAARAGEAGKGFAVVASEVKALATQTTTATSQIFGEISKVQEVAKSVAEGVRSILSSADEVGGYVTATASAIEEQSVVTRDISDNTSRSALSVREIADRIRSLSAG